MTPEQRVLRARIGGLTTSLRGHTTTEAARAKFLSRFDLLVDPDGVLSPVERVRRSEAARKAYMTRLALRSSVTRGKKKAARASASRAATSEVQTNAHPTA